MAPKKSKLDKILQMQDKNMDIQNMAKKLEITPSALRSYMNRCGYKCIDGKYILKQAGVKDKKAEKVKVKKSCKVNVTEDDMDKLYEVYDWYLSIKDIKTLNPKKKSRKDLDIENIDIKELKTTSIRVGKNVWEDFERLCSNSSHKKSDIITQAIKNYMRENKHLL